MIGSAHEFKRLRTSEDLEDQRRASFEPAETPVWMETIERFPELRKWVAHNKTVPLDILQALASDIDPKVRSAVASKRKLDRELFELLAQDIDPSVRQRIACNRKTPADIVANLTRDADVLVARAAMERTQK